MPAKPPEDLEDLDPGLAAERTRLAWSRTAIAFAAVGAIALRNDVVVGLLILAGAPCVWALGHFAEHTVPPDQRSRRLLLVTVAVTAAAVLATIGALLGRSPASLHDILPLHG
jgi:uncharacterized membrane protein YidH (DUF202 family)